MPERKRESEGSDNLLDYFPFVVVAGLEVEEFSRVRVPLHEEVEGGLLIRTELDEVGFEGGGHVLVVIILLLLQSQ